jgi:hypothetical protein
MSKSIFINLCKSRGVSTENAKKAWDKIKFLAQYIKKNWDEIEELEYMSQDKKLELRRFAAEKGTEYTPDELEELVKFICLVKRNIKDWEE